MKFDDNNPINLNYIKIGAIGVDNSISLPTMPQKIVKFNFVDVPGIEKPILIVS